MSTLFEPTVIALTLALIVGMIAGHVLGFYGGKKHWMAVEWDNARMRRIEADRARREHNGQWKKKGAKA